MTALERLNARPGPIHPSRRRAPARTAKVRSNSDTSPQDTPPKMQNKPALHFTLQPTSVPPQPLLPAPLAP
jgi:hypothetical protein